MAGSHEYCCCAIPVLNVGIYLTILEQFTVALLGGVLAIATPHIVGASVPSFAPWLFAIGCFIACGVQGLGFFGVFKENAKLFQRYVQVNTSVVMAVLGVGLTWTVISATQHTKSTNDCVTNFYVANATSADAANALDAGGQGETICNIFTWAEVGIMGGLLLVMIIFQGYLLLVTRWYSTSQLADHSKYYSIYSASAPEGINLGERQTDAWDPRPSTESWSGGAAPGAPRPNFADHGRTFSDISERTYGVGAADYAGDRKEPALGYQDQNQHQEDYNPYVAHPEGAYTNEAEPTPVALVSPQGRYQQSAGYGEPSGSVPTPEGARYPNEGQFGRKTPRAEDTSYGGYGQPPPGPSYGGDDRYGQQPQRHQSYPSR